MSERAQQHHRERLEEALREEISAILEGELADPRIGLATVTNLEMPAGHKTVHVYVAVPGDEAEGERTLEGLRSAKGYIRHEVAERLRLHHPPELVFHLDRSDQIVKKIEAVAKRTRRKV